MANYKTRQKAGAQQPLIYAVGAVPAIFGIEAGNNAAKIVAATKTSARVMGMTRGAFSLLDLIHEFLRAYGAAEVIVCTWSAGIKDLAAVGWLRESGLITSIAVITDYSYATRKASYVASVGDIIGEENVFVSDIHAKFVLIANDAVKICIRSSMNLNANRTCESFEVDLDAAIYDFYRTFAMTIIREMPAGLGYSQREANDGLDKVFDAIHMPFADDDDALFAEVFRKM